MGFPDQARTTSEEALEWARKIDHPNTIGNALCFGVALTNIWLRNVTRVLAAAEESVRLSEEKSLALWEMWSRIALAWVRLQQGDRGGLEEMEASLANAERMGALRFRSFYLGLLAEAQTRFGETDAAEATLNAAFEMHAMTKDMPFEADLYRLRAAVRLHASRGATEDAAADLLHAIEIARREDALSLEMRAARDLARLRADQGDRETAHGILAPVYSRFTEGFDTPDLKDAKALLDELAG